MGRYVVKRLLWTVVVLWAIVTLTFAATFLSPVDPARSYAGQRASNDVVERVREDFGLNDPLYVQYWRYLERIAHGDFGNSYSTGIPVRDAILDRLPETLMLAFAASPAEPSGGSTLSAASSSGCTSR